MVCDLNMTALGSTVQNHKPQHVVIAITEFLALCPRIHTSIFIIIFKTSFPAHLLAFANHVRYTGKVSFIWIKLDTMKSFILYTLHMKG